MLGGVQPGYQISFFFCIKVYVDSSFLSSSKGRSNHQKSGPVVEAFLGRQWNDFVMLKNHAWNQGAR